jgi:hypothetical protein
VGGWVGVGGVGGWSEIKIKANSAHLKLELGLSLAKIVAYLSCSAGRTHFALTNKSGNLGVWMQGTT